MSGLNTKDIKTGGGLPKILEPGNHICTLNGVTLEEFKFKAGGYHIVLHLEGPDLGKDFEGFFLDKNNESLGRYKGQVGQVKAGQWAFADGKTNGGVEISRNAEMLKFMKSLCISFNIVPWLDSQDGKHETIESLIGAFNTEKPFKNVPITFCIAGKEYMNKAGYLQYELFLPKYTKAGAPFGAKTITFNDADHIVKKKVETVEEFASDATTTMEEPSTSIATSNEDFKLD